MSKIKKWKILIGLWIGIGSCVQSMEAKGGSKKISKFFTYNEKKELETKIHS